MPNDSRVAIKENKKNILEILLKNERVDFEVKDKNGDFLITIAYKTGNIEMVKLLEENRGRVAQDLKKKRQEVVELRNVKQRHDDFLLNLIYLISSQDIRRKNTNPIIRYVDRRWVIDVCIR